MWGTQKVISSQGGSRSSTAHPIAGDAAFGDWRKSLVEGAYKPSKHLQEKGKAPGSARSSKASARGGSTSARAAAKPTSTAAAAAPATPAAATGSGDASAAAPAGAPEAAPAAASAAEPSKPLTEEQEVRGLISLFNASRESPVPVGVYVKYQQSLENIAKAEQVSRHTCCVLWW